MFTDQKYRPSEIGDKVNLALVFNKEKADTQWALITRKYVKGYGCLPYGRNLSDKYENNLIDTVTITRMDVASTSSKQNS